MRLCSSEHDHAQLVWLLSLALLGLNMIFHSIFFVHMYTSAQVHTYTSSQCVTQVKVKSNEAFIGIEYTSIGFYLFDLRVLLEGAVGMFAHFHPRRMRTCNILYDYSSL